MRAGAWWGSVAGMRDVPTRSPVALGPVALGMVVTGLVVMGLLAGCTRAALPVALDPEPLVKVTPTPTPTPTPTQPEPLPPADPFELVVAEVQLASTSNAGMFGVAEPPADRAVAEAAVAAAADRLTAFLDAMFVAPATRLSPAAVGVVLDPATVPPDHQAGLGVLQAPTLLGTVTGQAEAVGHVLLDGTRVGAVSLIYTASLELVLADARGPVTQHGVASFVDRGTGPVLVGIEARTTFGGDLAEALS